MDGGRRPNVPATERKCELLFRNWPQRQRANGIRGAVKNCINFLQSSARMIFAEFVFSLPSSLTKRARDAIKKSLVILCLWAYLLFLFLWRVTNSFQSNKGVQLISSLPARSLGSTFPKKTEQSPRNNEIQLEGKWRWAIKFFWKRRKMRKRRTTKLFSFSKMPTLLV